MFKSIHDNDRVLYIQQLSFAWDKPETADGLMRLKPRKPGLLCFLIPIFQAQIVDFKVTENSIRSLKRRALRRTKTLHRDAETGDVIHPTKISAFLSKLKAPFCRSYWEDRFEPTEEELLVDGKLLSYAYFEIGMIETIARYVPFI